MLQYAHLNLDLARSYREIIASLSRVSGKNLPNAIDFIFGCTCAAEGGKSAREIVRNGRRDFAFAAKKTKR
jgi:hypothetical protein